MTELSTGTGPGSEHWGYVYTADDERLIALLDDTSNPLTNWTVRGLGNEVLTRDDHYPAAGSPPPLPPETCPGPNGIFCDDFEEGTVGAWASNSGLQTRTITDYLFRDGQLLASNTLNGGGAEHFSLDHLGTPRIVTDDVFGSVVATHTYFPFGQKATPTDQDTEPLKFTGHERDLQTSASNTADDLDYMHARFRSPLTGRFLATDTHRANAGDVASLNRYAYVYGNPIRLIDRNGLEADSAFGFAFTGSLSTPERFAQLAEGAALGARDGLLLSGGALLAAGAAALGPESALAAALGEAFSKPAIQRGNEVEAILAERYGGGLPRTFPVIDRFLNGVATSVKSLDLGARSYQNLSRLSSTLQGFVSKLSNFRGATLGGAQVSGKDITQRVLELVIQSSRLTVEQAETIAKAAQEAQKNGVMIRVVAAY